MFLSSCLSSLSFVFLPPFFDKTLGDSDDDSHNGHDGIILPFISFDWKAGRPLHRHHTHSTVLLSGMPPESIATHLDHGGTELTTTFDMAGSLMHHPDEYMSLLRDITGARISKDDDKWTQFQDAVDNSNQFATFGFELPVVHPNEPSFFSPNCRSWLSAA